MSSKNTKKTGNTAETTADSRTIVLVSLAQDANAENVQETAKVRIAAGNSPAERLHNALNTEAEIYLVTTENLKTSVLQELKKQQKVATDAFYTAVYNKKRNYLNEWLAGVSKSENNSPFTLFGKEAFERFVNENVLPTNSFELNYIAEKTCAKQNLTYLDGKENDRTSLVNQMKVRLGAAARYYTGGGSKALNKYAFVVLSILIFLFITTRSQTAAISGDEFTQHNFSNYIVDYFSGKDDSAAMGLVSHLKVSDREKTQFADMKNYGCGFDTFCNYTARWFGVKDIMEWRHFWNAFFGFLVMFYGALIVRRVTKGSWKYAWIALLVLCFMPRFFGDSMNNPKDVPFATGYVLAFYYMLKTFKNFGLIRISSVVGLIVAIGLGISIRVGGLLSIGIMCAYAAFEFIQQYGLNIFKNMGAVIRVATLLFVVAFLGYFAGLLPWPYGLEAPFTNPFKSLKAFNAYGVNIRQLFEGNMYDSQMLPKSYLVKYIWITTPVGIMLGWLLYIAGAGARKFKISAAAWMCLFAAAFPIIYIYASGGKVYGGLRHILFTLPMMGICGVLGFYFIEKLLSKIKVMSIAVPAALVLVTALPAGFVMKSHPLEYIYFNELAGGLKGAYGKYEMDYYLASLKPTTEWFLENVARKNPNKRFQLGTYDQYITQYYCRKDTNVKVGFVRPEQRNSTAYLWDYSVFYNGYNDNYRLTHNLYPPPGTVYAHNLEGKPMGIVVKRMSYDDAYGKKAEDKKQFDSATAFYKSYLSKDPQSYEVWTNLSGVYASKGNLDSAIICTQKALDIYPEYQSGLLAMAYYQKGKNQFDKSIALLEKYLKLRPMDADNYGELAQMYLEKYGLTKDQNLLNTGLKKVNEGIVAGASSAKCYWAGYNICNALKDAGRAAQYGKVLEALQKRQGLSSEVLDIMTELYNNASGKNYETDRFANEVLGFSEEE